MSETPNPDAAAQEGKTLSLREASDSDKLKEAVYNALSDEDDSTKQYELERISAQVAAARQYQDSLNPGNPSLDDPVVFLGA